MNRIGAFVLGVAATLLAGVLAGALLSTSPPDLNARRSEVAAAIQRSEELSRTADEFIELGNYDSASILAALRALRHSNDDCAVCILELDLRIRANGLESFSLSATSRAAELAKTELARVRAYLGEHPVDEAACKEACAGR